MEKRNIEIQAENIGEGIKLIKISGALDTITSPQADKIIEPWLEESENIIVDCTDLKYINSTGLLLLVKYHIHLAKRNKHLKILIINKSLREIMDISGAMKLLDVYRTKEEAIESFK